MVKILAATPETRVKFGADTNAKSRNKKKKNTGCSTAHKRR
jgi:hypothetical protein